MRHLVPAILIAWLGTVSPTLAQMECSPALVVSTHQQIELKSTDSRLAMAVSKSAYEEVKTKEGASGSLFGVKIGANFEDYHHRASNESSSYGSSLSQQEFGNILWTGLDPLSPSAYSACLDSLRGSRGLDLRVKAATETDVTVVATWVPVGNDPMEIKPEWQWASKGNQATFPTTLRAGSFTKVLQRPTMEQSLAVNYPGFTDSLTITPYPKLEPAPPLVKVVEAADIQPGGYMTYDASQNLIVSGHPGGGPSENFSIVFDTPRAGTYSLKALWTSGSPTEVHVYTKAFSKSCTASDLNMDDADLHYLPNSRGGWSASTLPLYPDVIGNVLLPKGSSTIIFTSRSCGHGLGGGRLPSTRWISFTRLDD